MKKSNCPMNSPSALKISGNPKFDWIKLAQAPSKTLILLCNVLLVVVNILTHPKKFVSFEELLAAFIVPDHVAYQKVFTEKNVKCLSLPISNGL